MIFMSTRNIFFLFLIFFQCFACQQGKGSGQQPDSISSEPSLQIRRFDKLLYNWLLQPQQSLPDKLSTEYQPFWEIYTNNIIEVGSPNDANIGEKVQTFFADNDLFSLYTSAENAYDSIADIELELGKAFNDLQLYFPEKQLPVLYMHVSGLNQSVIVGEDFLSLSIDKYLGEDYPLYYKYYGKHVRRNMIRTRIVPDYLTGWFYSEFDMGPENRLIDHMIYQGKILYALQVILSDIPDVVLFGFSQQELDRCLENEKEIWNYILKNKHLYTTDYLIISKYMNEAPHSAFFSDDYPSRIGSFLGFRIVSQYMNKNKKVTLSDLLHQQNNQQILSKSKYK